MYLNCHTAFSFKYGTLPVQRLFDEARKNGVHKLVLTEINNTASYIEMLRLCAENAPVGMEQDSNPFPHPPASPEKSSAGSGGGVTSFGDPAWSLEIAAGIEFRRDRRLLYIAIAQN